MVGVPGFPAPSAPLRAGSADAPLAQNQDSLINETTPFYEMVVAGGRAWIRTRDLYIISVTL